MIGTKLGPYEILSAIGAGGMGEVYKARDTPLDRTVAIKVLPAQLAQRSDSRERFEREARAVSSLSHPHICTLYDVGQHDGTDYLVMEYLEGETLEARLAKGPLPLQQALQCAIDIADALAAAHRAGITHRDLKPGNVMLTKSGPKVLDFGLAKTQPAAASFDSQSAVPTRAATLTGEGIILGTLQYLSPEQIEGKEADPRTDIFAFGAMLYEMVTGKQAFQGKSQVSLLAAILEHEPPPMSVLPKVTSQSLEHLLRRCVAKDPDQRWQSAVDVLYQLRWILEVGSAPAIDILPRKRWFWVAATATALLAVVVSFVVRFRDVSAGQPVIRYSIPLPKHGQSEGLFFYFHMSPDGRFAAVQGVLEQDLGIFIRESDSWDYRLLRTNADGDFFWSPDSRHIAFFDNGKLKKVKVTGGPAEDICDVAGTYGTASGSWNKDDLILFSPPAGGPLLRVAATGGQPRGVTKPGNAASHLYPTFLADGRHFLYTQRGSSPGVYLASLDNPEGRRLLADESSAEFAPSAPGSTYAHLIFTRDGKFMAQRFDQKALELVGDAFVLAERALWNDNGSAAVSVSDNGILSYRGGRSRNTDSRLAWFDRSGRILAAEGIAGPQAFVSLSPDAQTAAVFRRQSGQFAGDLWLREFTRGFENRVTYNGTIDYDGNVVWAPDGRRVVFSAGDLTSLDLYRKTDLYVKDIYAASQPEPVLQSGNRKTPTDWSRDGFLLYTEITAKMGADLWYVRLDLGGRTNDKPVPFLQTQFDEGFGQLSPDGHWIAYVSNESGSYDVYIRPFPSGAGKWKVSSSAGIGTATQEPRWNPNGKELFYITGSAGEFTVISVTVSTRGSGAASTLDIGAPKPLFKARVNAYAPITSTLFYSVSKDGQRFLINHVDSNAEPVLNVIVNWQRAFLGSTQ